MYFEDPNLVAISGNKKSSVVIMNKRDYQNKKEQMIEIHLLGKFFSQPHELDALGKTWKHQ